MDDDEYRLEEIVEITSLTEVACLRPRLHTATGSIEEVYSFINALTFAKLEAESKVAKAAVAWLLRNAELIESKLNFDELRSKFGSDAEALCVLVRELNENAP